MPKKRNAPTPAVSPATARDAAKKSAAKAASSADPTKTKRLPKRSVILSAAKDLSRPTSNVSRPRSRSSKRNRSKLASPSAVNAALKSAFVDARPVSTAPPPRIRIGDAMRRSGLDEYKVARTFAGVVDKLSDGTKDTGGVQKLLVDALKECSRHLDPPQSERAAPGAPVHITMVHNVPRPVRTQPPQQPQQQLNAAPSAAPATDAASTAPAGDANTAAAPNAASSNEPVKQSDSTPSS